MWRMSGKCWDESGLVADMGGADSEAWISASHRHLSIDDVCVCLYSLTGQQVVERKHVCTLGGFKYAIIQPETLNVVACMSSLHYHLR
jgi:hypothetical protein